MLTARFALGYDEPLGRACGSASSTRLGLQQRRLRALQRQPDRLRRPTRGSACRSCVARDPRRPRLPGAFELRRRLAPPAPWSSHADDRRRHRRRCWRGHSFVHGRSSGPTRAPSGRSTVAGQAAGRRSSRRSCRARPGSTASTTAHDATRRRCSCTDVLMFIGGGSAGTAGGIKVTTFILLVFVICAEVRGRAGRRGVRPAHRPPRRQRQALTVALLGVRPWSARRRWCCSLTPTSARPGAVRGDLRVRHRRAVHRHHRRPARRRRRSC